MAFHQVPLTSNRGGMLVSPTVPFQVIMELPS